MQNNSLSFLREPDREYKIKKCKRVELYSDLFLKHVKADTLHRIFKSFTFFSLTLIWT
jgi:hypothetical protein